MHLLDYLVLILYFVVLIATCLYIELGFRLWAIAWSWVRPAGRVRRLVILTASECSPMTSRGASAIAASADLPASSRMRAISSALTACARVQWGTQRSGW